MVAAVGGAVHPVNGGDAIIVGLSHGGTGSATRWTVPPGKWPRDVTKNLVSADVASDVYGVVLTGRGHVNADATRAERAAQVAARLQRGRPYEEFEAGVEPARAGRRRIASSSGPGRTGAVVNPLPSR